MKILQFCILLLPFGLVGQNGLPAVVETPGVKPASVETTAGKGVTPVATPHSAIPNPQSTRAVVVGISDYQDVGIPDLRFADRDAEAFANFLRSPAGGSLDGDHLKVLTNKDATTAQFDAALGWLIDESKEGDQAIIYFSGHGDVETKTRSQQGFLLCWDSPPQAYVSGAYPVFFLKEVVSTLSLENKARVVVITDACRSGKLAGNAVGGSQLTSQNLAQQFANEIKILSCQPDEYSIEGEQWGGGRGAFSFHLVDGLYGMADGNADASVNLMEIGRYLDDHVTTEVAPQSQVPMTVGNRTEKLAAVFPDLLAQVRKNKAGQLPTFSPTENRGIEEDVLATVDTTVREQYRLFKKAMKDKVFLEPVGACADAYYLRLMAEPKLGRLHNAMRRNYAAALQDDAQQAINNLMKMEKTEVRLYRLERLKKYAPYPRLLARAAELLGEQHYMYPTLQARKCYFEGQVLQMESSVNADSLLGRRLLDKYRESLSWQPDAALTYLGMSEVFARILPNTDSVLWHGRKAIEVAPNLIRAYTQTAVNLFKPSYIDIGQKLLDQALAQDSNQVIVWHTYGLWHFAQGQGDAGEPYLFKAMALDSTASEPYFLLGVLSFERGKMQESEQYFLKAAQTDKPDPNTFNYLGAIHFNAGHYAEAERYYLQGLAIEPNHLLCLTYLAGTYWKTQRPDEAKALLFQAMAYDSTSFQAQFNIGQAFWANGFDVEAEIAYQKAIAINSNAAIAYYQLACVQVYQNRMGEAFATLEIALKIGEYGYSYSSMQEDLDLAPLRALPEWKTLMKKYFPDEVKD